MFIRVTAGTMQRADIMNVSDNIAIRLERLNGNSPGELFEKIADIDNRCFTYEKQSAASFREDAARDNKILICAFCNNEAAGFICGAFAADQSDIVSIAVCPEYRRMGIADSLIAEFENALPDITESIFLEVRESNSAAQTLYMKHGFEKISVRKNYYEMPDENAVIMRKFRT